MNKCKKIVFILFLFFITGCSVNYNLEISEDMSLSENVEASENTTVMQTNTNLVGEDAVNYLYEMFAPDDIDFSFSNEDNKTIGISNRTFSSLEEYIENFSSDVFGEINLKKEKGIYTITANQLDKLGNNGSQSLIYDDININLTIPFRVIDNNADEVNGNIYTWKIEKNSKLKNIMITFDKNDPITSSSIVVGNKVINYKIIFVTVIIGVFAVFSIVLYMVVRNKKNNSI